jgi:hypothetical protein
MQGEMKPGERPRRFGVGDVEGVESQEDMRAY